MYAYFMAVGIDILFCSVTRRSEMMFMLSKMSCTIHSWTGMCWWLWQDYCRMKHVQWRIGPPSGKWHHVDMFWHVRGSCCPSHWLGLWWRLQDHVKQQCTSYQTTWCHYPEDGSLYTHGHENLSIMLCGGINVFTWMESTHFVKVKSVHHFMTFY